MSEDRIAFLVLCGIALLTVLFGLMIVLWRIFQRFQRSVGITLILTIVLGNCLRFMPKDATRANLPWLIGGIVVVCMPFVSLLVWKFLQEIRLIPPVHDHTPVSQSADTYPVS